jgi:hypothetical protein
MRLKRCAFRVGLLAGLRAPFLAGIITGLVKKRATERRKAA